MRELDGVVDEVHNDLAQPVGVANKVAGNVRAPVAPQFDALFGGSNSKRSNSGPKTVAHVEADRMQFQTARFDLREIENVIEDREERYRRTLHRFEIDPLFGS